MRVRNLILKRLLGFGGQGRVYAAQGPARSEIKGEDKWRVYAVKVMIKSRYVQFDDILREQNLLRRLRGNRLLLQIEGSFHDRKNFYLITEYHSGGDLEDLLRTHGCCSTSAARIYTAELCAAVGFLHQNFILHRDVKPSNVLIKADGHLCLSDFGLAVDFLDHATDGEENEPVIRGCAGTTMYMSPEALNGEYYGFKADWWSVGATCFNLFEGMVRMSLPMSYMSTD
ncbi:kinase-like protein [Macrolepiota fuliginosa MF-IS2]|uniref:Kinase-like protein n=1 Tax=Macrolepiota fuliginosa MF-IS2 TaxID=1400762 RepID=A0A9P5XF27_9AGAR|nr:kinase-like protein [Macrolepiota fuliginosa MF-IS2]